MFITRLISGILLVIAAIAVFHYGGILLSAVLCILSLIGCYEIYKVTKMEKHPIAVVGYLSTLAYYVLISFGLEQWLMAEMILFAIVSLIVFVARFPKDEFQTVAIGFFTVIYVSVLLACIYQTRQLNNGQWLVWMILIGSWGSDTCAYATGRLLGKHHFSELSPKKTIEGCVGGVLGAAIIAYIFGCYFPDGHLFLFDKRIVFVFIATISAVISQIGDLVASSIKRKNNVKDFGKLIPGHGGVMDRFDSVIFVAPFVYYLLVLVTSNIG